MSIEQRLTEAGVKLGFQVREQIGASESAWVDLVWFDGGLPVPDKGFNMHDTPALPVVGFEIEHHTALNAKHVKGSVSNLNNLGAQLGIIVIGRPNLTALESREPWKGKDDKALKHELRNRAFRWIYAEAQPRVRINVMFEDDVERWIDSLKAHTQARAAAV